MVMTVAATGFCFIPGLWGWVAIIVAIAGLIIGLLGMTNTKTGPGGLGMDVASWVYGILALTCGLAFQTLHAEGALDFLLAPLSMNVAAILAAALLPLFIGTQILARKKFRYVGVGVAFILYLTLCEFAFTALTLAHRDGIQLFPL